MAEVEGIPLGGTERDFISKETVFEKYKIPVDESMASMYHDLDEQERLAARHLARLGVSPKIPGIFWSVDEQKLIIRKTPLSKEMLSDEEIREKALSIKKGEGGFSEIGLDFDFINWYESSEHRLVFQIINLRQYSDYSSEDQEEKNNVADQIKILMRQIRDPEMALARRRRRLALAYGYDEDSELINTLISKND